MDSLEEITPHNSNLSAYHAAMDEEEEEEEKRNEIEGWICPQNTKSTKSINLDRILMISFQSKLQG